MSRGRSYLWTVALIGAATAIGLPLRGVLADPDLVMLYLLAIAVAAARFGRGPSVAASAASVLAYDFFFVAPYHTLRIADQHYLLTFAIMFAVGLVTSRVALRVRRGEVEATRSALLSSVSHDLRAPLAAITSAATVLRDTDAALAPAQRAALAGAICEEADRLERLVGNLLEATRVASGTLEVRRSEVPLEQIAVAALARLEGALAGRPVTTAFAAGLPMLSVDPILLEQLFVNLLDNAAKYTPPGTPIAIGARVSRGAVEVDVDDHGPGLPPGELERLFETFTRGPTEVPGAGLGLAICRGIAEAHGGTLAAERRAGGGARFCLRLPLAALRARAGHSS
jgi:two-component system sensor histidine kinase KdpD